MESKAYWQEKEREKAQKKHNVPSNPSTKNIRRTNLRG